MFPGRPRPSVTWWHKNAILDNVVDTKKNSFTTVNQLEIAQVPRSLKGAKLECRATSMDIAEDIVREVPIVVYRKSRYFCFVFSRAIMGADRCLVILIFVEVKRISARSSFNGQ